MILWLVYDGLWYVTMYYQCNIVVFIVRQLQEKHLGEMGLCFALWTWTGLLMIHGWEVWWAVQKFCVEEWPIRLVWESWKLSTSSQIRTAIVHRLHASGDEMEVKFGGTSGFSDESSVVNIIMVLEALSRDCITGCPWELLPGMCGWSYADDWEHGRRDWEF